MTDCRDVLDRHKRLVHTKPEDREPPKKRGRPSRSSDKDSKGSPVHSVSPSNERQSPSDSHRHEVDNNPTIDPQLSAHSPIQFPRLPGETPGSSFLTNPFNDNFESGPLDTFSDFNFAGEEILSFLNPPQSNLHDGEIMSLSTTGDPENMDGVLLHHHDYASWLHLNRDENTSPHSNASCGVLAETASTPLIEPGESKEMFVPQDKPKASFAINEENYAQLQEKLDAKYKVQFHNLEVLIIEISPRRFRITKSTIPRTICIPLFRLLLPSLPHHPSPNI
jgi:hypothetical protein